MGKTKPVTKYRGTSQEFHTMEGSEHGQQENAVIRDFEFEVQEQGKVEEMTTGRAKRIRCLYSPENENSLKNSVLHPESLEFLPFSSTGGNSSLKPGLAAERTSSKSTDYDSSASDSEDHKVSKSSDAVKRKILKLRGVLKTHNQQSVSVDIKNQNTDGTNQKTGEYLELEVEELYQSAFAGNCLEVTSSYLDLLDINQQGVMGTTLVDADLTVQASQRAESVPFVCQKSESYGIAILGYPLEIEIRDNSKSLLPTKESVACKLFGDNGSRFHELVWRTSKRTPVCYVTNSLSSSIPKDVQAEQASKNVEDSISPARENDVLIKEKSIMELLKKPTQLNQGKTAISQTCVPVELIFSKILAAVCQVQS